MKHLLVAIVAFTMAASASQAQTAQAGSQSGAASQSASLSGAQSNNQIIFPSAPSNTEADINTVPSVYAPSVSGGAHPCLAGASAGASWLGAGISGGGSGPETICMLAWLGQPEAAIRALAASSPKACKALNNVGYYTVPGKGGSTRVVPFKCGPDTVQGGTFTKNVATTTVSTNSGASTIAYAKCDYDKATNKLTFKKKANASSASAKAQCLTALGF